MARVPFTTGKGWFPRVFPGFVGPSAIDDTVILTTPAEGRDNHNKVRHATVVGEDGAESATTAVVPATKQWYVPFATGYHTDAASTPQMSLRLIDPDGSNWISIAELMGATVNLTVVLRQPIIVPPLWALQSVSNGASIAPGSVVVLRYAFVELPAGEYVPPI